MLEMAKDAAGKLQVLQGPSSHERSGLLHREATRASLPIAARVAERAEEGRPEP